ncbi:MAG: hypothetical protein WCR23_08995 [Planctomycetota bacterium]|nr:hypothetical protein [Planctomycetia bacterium]
MDSLLRSTYLADVHRWRTGNVIAIRIFSPSLSPVTTILMYFATTAEEPGDED